MGKLQITKGDYKVREADKNNWANVSINDDTVFTVYATHCIDIDNDISRDLEATNISKIAADSLNTYQQCETLPSELLRQNREMKEAVKKILKKATIQHTTIRDLLMHPETTDENQINKLQAMDRILNNFKCDLADCLTSCNKGNK